VSGIPVADQPWRAVARRRQWWLAILVIGQSLAGLWLLEKSLPVGADGWAVTLLLLVFAVLFLWIGLGFWTAAFGFFFLRRGGDPWCLDRQCPASPATGFPPTAVVMPVCHEPVHRTLNNLEAIYRELRARVDPAAFDFYVLSDSVDPEIWLEEQAACTDLCARVGGEPGIFYRRRRIRRNFKSGNIADFLRRWGHRYRYMVVLDADSLLEAEAIVRLVQLMEHRPRAGIIQTAPRLARAETRFARLQQFANRCYGRLYSAGLAAIQLGDATYWGHNAILRTAPFMRHCGLRRLKGPGLFSGPVLSHDYIESALMGRAGFEVWLEPSIGGSYEESPPTLADDLIRDRRWCRGNLQHLWHLFTLAGLRPVHRLALLTGILCYLASPLWLGFLALSGYLGVHTQTPPPVLPGLAGGSIGLAGTSHLLMALTATLLLGPRLLALVDQTLAGRSNLFGGPARLAASVLGETLMALVLAPVRMLVHSVQVGRALANLRTPWQGQNRAGSPGSAAQWWPFIWPMVMAAVALALLLWQTPELTPWALPVLLPLLVIPALAPWLARPTEARGWALVPEAVRPSPVLQRADASSGYRRLWPALSRFEQQVLAPPHSNQVFRNQAGLQGRKQQLLARLVDRCARAGSQALNDAEIGLLCAHPESLQALHYRAWQADSDTPWGQVLARLEETLDWRPEPTGIRHDGLEHRWVGVAS